MFRLTTKLWKQSLIIQDQNPQTVLRGHCYLQTETNQQVISNIQSQAIYDRGEEKGNSYGKK
jgi:hypothetical protein